MAATAQDLWEPWPRRATIQSMKTTTLGPLTTSAIGYGAMVLAAADVVLDPATLARIDELAPPGAAAGEALL
jgi:hypothetical protein